MKDNKLKKEVFTNYTLILQLGLHVLVPLFLCVGIGIFIDNKYNMYLTLPLLIVGILAGGRNAYVLACKANRKSEYEKKKIEEEEYVNDVVKKWSDVENNDQEKEQKF